MFLFQAYISKDTEGKPDNTPLGIKIKHINAFLSEKILDPQEFDIAMKQADKLYENKELANFISSLTPGAQNAIHAASFAWGYENAAKYIKNAMKLDEVKNASDPLERSGVIIQNIQNQAQADGQHEKITQVSNFAWSYYNEDLKETQAQAMKSEAISEKESTPQKDPVQQQTQIQLPLTSSEAVTQSIAQDTEHPALIYCALAAQQAEEQSEIQILAKKREELGRLITLRPVNQKEEETARTMPITSIEEREKELVQNAIIIALERKKELDTDYLKSEQQIQAAVDKLDTLSTDDKKNAEKIAAMLPSELANHILLHKTKYAKRAALKKQLLRWVAFSQKSRKSINALSLDRLKKLVKLFSLFK